MCYIELCNKKDKSPCSFSRQIGLKNVELASRFHRAAMVMRVNYSDFRFSNLNAYILFTTS